MLSFSIFLYLQLFYCVAAKWFFLVWGYKWYERELTELSGIIKANISVEIIYI